MKSVKMQSVVCFLALSLSASSVFAAKGNFEKRHPRRAQVIKREKNEMKKNEAAEETGKITERQEKSLNRKDQLIRREEQADAAAHGGQITKGEQRDLNRQENSVNRERRRMERRDAAAKNKVKTPNAVSAPSAGVPASTVPATTTN